MYNVFVVASETASNYCNTISSTIVKNLVPIYSRQMRDKRGVGKKDPSKYRTITYFLGNECDVYVVTGEATITSTTTTES